MSNALGSTTAVCSFSYHLVVDDSWVQASTDICLLYLTSLISSCYTVSWSQATQAWSLPLQLCMFSDKLHNCFFLHKMRVRIISTPTLQDCCETKFWINICQQIPWCSCSLLFLQCQVQSLKEGIQQTSADSPPEWIYQMVITTILRHFILALLNFKFLATATSWNPSKR